MRPVMDDPANAGVRFGFRAHWPEVHVKWTVPGAGRGGARRPDRARRSARSSGTRCSARARRSCPQLVVARLAARGERVALAESCTGGLLAELVTRVPGASAVFDLGVVAYANAMKERVLGVPAGAARRARRGLRAGGARARRGGAARAGARPGGSGSPASRGPTGGTPEKPVGTVHLALAGPAGTSAAPAALPRRPRADPPLRRVRGAEPPAARDALTRQYRSLSAGPQTSGFRPQRL